MKYTIFEKSSVGVLEIFTAAYGITRDGASPSILAGQFLSTSEKPVRWDSVAWDDMARNSEACNRVAWNCVAWNSKACNSGVWNGVAWNSIVLELGVMERRWKRQVVS